MPDLYNYSKKKNEQSMIEADVGKRKKEQFIENLREGDVVNDLYAVKLKILHVRTREEHGLVLL